MNPSPDLLKSLGFFMASSAKINLERRYDRLAKSETVQALQGLPKPARLGIASLLNGLATFFDRYLKEDTAFQKFTKELLVDAGPELGKRVINGSHEEQETYRSLLAMEHEDLLTLLAWLQSTPPEDRRELMEKVSSLSPSEIQNFLCLSPEQRDVVITLFWKKEEPKVDILEPISSRLRQYIARRKKEKEQQR